VPFDGPFLRLLFFQSIDVMHQKKKDINDNLKWRKKLSKTTRGKENFWLAAQQSTFWKEAQMLYEMKFSLVILSFLLFFSLCSCVKRTVEEEEKKGELIKIQSARSRTIDKSMHWFWGEKRREENRYMMH
jgi:hypothetical protein